MKNPTTIETLTGEVNLPTASAKARVLLAGSTVAKNPDDLFIGVAAKSPQAMDRISALSPYPVVTPSIQGYDPKIGGQMFRQSFVIEEGAILKFFVNRRAGYGKLPVTATRFLRVRPSAPLRTLTGMLLTDPKVGEPFAFIRGRFDLLTAEEAVALGAKVRAEYTKTFAESLCASVMTDTIHEAETAAVQIVKVAGAPAQAMVVKQAAVRRRCLTINPTPSI